MMVDDNSMNIMILQRMLEMIPAARNIELTQAGDGKEALELYKGMTNSGKKRVKLILMDCEMPIMDGYEASKKIREFEANLKKASPTMIVGLSGNSGDAFNRKCRQCGMNDTITKPVAIEQLTKMVQKALNT
jgi:CheY-like chemotaxis protein